MHRTCANVARCKTPSMPLVCELSTEVKTAVMDAADCKAGTAWMLVSSPSARKRADRSKVYVVRYKLTPHGSMLTPCSSAAEGDQTERVISERVPASEGAARARMMSDAMKWEEAISKFERNARR